MGEEHLIGHRHAAGEEGSWQHDHTFGTDSRTTGERRTWWVIALTAAMMTIEIAAGLAYGSMALLADGWHMGTHAAALSVTAFAYVFARRHAGDRRFSFGTGKVGALGGFASAVGLAVVALLVFGESTLRLAAPTSIRFDEAIFVACVGLAVNLVCALLLQEHHHHDDGHDHEHDHATIGGEHRDLNLRGAYLHVLADALTSVLAIAALSAGKFLGWNWMDPMMGVVGSLVIARWSWGLLRDTSRVLLDAEIDTHRLGEIRAEIEAVGEDRVTDLHLWRVGPRHLAAIVAVAGPAPRSAAHYKRLLARHADLAHITVEVHRDPATADQLPG